MVNILIIMSDQHNQAVMGCSGDPIVRTPHMDALAQSGIQFDQCYAPSPLCVPARASFLTSRLPSKNRVWSETSLPSCTPTMAHVLALAGYETTLIGRMHFIGPDQRHGFERRPIGEFTARYPGTRPVGGPPWKHYSSASAGQFRAGLEASGHGTTFYQIFDESVTEAACRFLEEEKSESRPFFALVGFILPHCPYIAKKSLFDYYLDKVDVPEVPANLPESVIHFMKERGLDYPPVSEKRTRIARAAYYALTETLDINIGKILEALHKNDLKRDTLVIYVSDHGDMLGQHGCWWKSLYYEGSVSVPFIASGPPVVSPGRVVQQPVSLLDVGPTLYELVKAKFIHANDGVSLLPYFRGNHQQASSAERAIISEMVDIRRDRPAVASRMIRQGQWKLWQTYDDKGPSTPALFDLKNDPDEKKDLGKNLLYACKRHKLLKSMHKDWDPAKDREAAVSMRHDLVEIIQRYGKAIEPKCEDTLPFPDPDLEKDVVIVEG
jgi:choline-sulfatase